MIISLITIYSCIKGIFLLVVWLSSLLTRNYSLFCATLVILDVEKEDGRQLWRSLTVESCFFTIFWSFITCIHLTHAALFNRAANP